jgi:uncharacterized protein DUF1707
MTTNQTSSPAIRASDAERERAAATIQTAVGAGRLTHDEAAERLTALYATRFRHELAPLTDDLPADEPEQAPAPSPTPSPTPWRGPLAAHAAVVVLLSVLLITRWIASGVPFFWPAFPIMWLAITVVIHARLRGARFRTARH